MNAKWALPAWEGPHSPQSPVPVAETPEHAAAASMLSRFPKAELQSRGVGFRWEDFLPALDAAVKAARAEERKRLESRITALENALHAHDPYHDLLNEDGATP